jgi:hypothetical protein
MATGYKYWLSRLFRRIGSRPVGNRRRLRLSGRTARALQPGFTISAMVEGLEARQLLSAATVNLEGVYQAQYNLTLDGFNHSTFAAGDFDAATVTPAGSSTAFNLPFAYCVDIPTTINVLTPQDYSAQINSTNFAAPAAGYNQDPRNTGVGTVNLNAIAWLAANEGKNLNLTQQADYVSGMALQVAIWEVEYNTPVTGVGWTDSIDPSGFSYNAKTNPTPMLTGDRFTLNTLNPKSFYTTSSEKTAFQMAFTADYAADIDAVNAAFIGGAVSSSSPITPGVMFINPFSIATHPVEQQTLISYYSVPTLSTTPTSASLGTKLADTATLAGGLGNAETGSITFTLVAPGGATVYTEVVPVSGDENYSTDDNGTGSNVANLVGTYQWNATYSGDTYNAPVIDNNNANEQTVVAKAGPSITSRSSVAGLANPSLPVPVSVALDASGPPVLQDSLTLSGGFNPTGTVDFYLFAPGVTPALDFSNAVYHETDTVSNGAASTATGYVLPTTGTVTGTYQWESHYSGDNLNNPADDVGAANEQVIVTPAIPMIVTTASSAVTLGTTAPTLTDSAVVSGGYYETGDLVFTLTGPTGVIYTNDVAVHGNKTYYSTDAGTTTGSATLPTTGTVAGTYTWSVSYNGDSNNKAAVDQGGTAEQTVVSPASPTISTVPNVTNVPLGTVVTLQDTATLTGGYHEQGSITFTLYRGATQVYTENVGVNGDGTYSTVTGYTLPVNGSEGGLYHWTAVYGDANNQTYTDAGGEVFTTLHVGSVYGGPYAFTLGSKTYTKYAAGAFTANTLGGQAEAFTYCIDISSNISFNTTYNAEVNSIGIVKSKNLNGGAGISATTARELAFLVANVATKPSYNSIPLDTTAMQLAIWSVEYGSQFTVTAGSESATVISDMNAYIALANNNVNTPIPGGVLFINPFNGTQASPNYNVQTQIAFDANFDAGEQVNVPLAAPTITATAGNAVTIGDGNPMTDSVVFANGYNATGSLTFSLYNTKGTLVYSDVVAVSGNGPYSTAAGSNPGGYVPKVTDIEGLYTWKVAYSGDGNNAVATDGGGAGALELVGANNIQAGDTAAIAFWNGTDGQSLINSLNGSCSSTAFAQWLGTTFPNLYGAGAGVYSMYKSGNWLTNAQVAAKYQSATFYGASGTKTYAQVLASALAVYVTDETLNADACSQAMATSFGFIESTSGIGGADYQLGANGTVFGAANNTEQTVMYLLTYLNANSAGGFMMGNNATKLNAIFSVFSGIDITGQSATTAADS